MRRLLRERLPCAWHSGAGGDRRVARGLWEEACCQQLGRETLPAESDTCLLVNSALGGHCRQREGAVSFCEAEDGVREQCNLRDGRGWQEIPAEAISCRPFAPQSGVQMTLRMSLGGFNEEEQRLWGDSLVTHSPLIRGRRWAQMVRENFLHRLRGHHPSGVGDAKQAPAGNTFWNLRTKWPPGKCLEKVQPPSDSLTHPAPSGL